MATKSAMPGTTSSANAEPDGQDSASTLLIHASAVQLMKKGVLLLGPSDSGKSDLALRLIDAGGVLIADDQVTLCLRADRLHAGPPEHLAGLIALRGLGIMRVPFEEAPLDLAVDLVAPGMAREPLPEPAVMSWLGVDLPRIGLEPASASAVARIRLALQAERAF